MELHTHKCPNCGRFHFHAHSLKLERILSMRHWLCGSCERAGLIAEIRNAKTKESR